MFFQHPPLCFSVAEQTRVSELTFFLQRWTRWLRTDGPHAGGPLSRECQRQQMWGVWVDGGGAGEKQRLLKAAHGAVAAPTLLL